MDNSGRFVYIEPNKITSDMPNNAIPQPYEDYCISVDLHVRNFSRYEYFALDNDNNRGNLDFTSENGTISFVGGTNGYLTTSFTDISSVNGDRNRECLGIESINISYQSYFYPEVVIKFIDVRGASLMVPQDNSYEKGDEKSSFYNSLFKFPYPIFYLTVKGFYGDAVTFKLAVSRSDIEFNSSTGNFEITVNFIGYMYGLYNDIPMQYITISPYIETDNSGNSGIYGYSKYWQSMVDSGVFSYTTKEGYKTPMLTYNEFREKLMNYAGELAEKVHNNENYDVLTRNTEMVSSIDTLMGTFPLKPLQGYSIEEILIGKGSAYSWNKHKYTDKEGKKKCKYWACIRSNNDDNKKYNELFINTYNAFLVNLKAFDEIHGRNYSKLFEDKVNSYIIATTITMVPSTDGTRFSSGVSSKVNELSGENDVVKLTDYIFHDKNIQSNTKFFLFEIDLEKDFEEVINDEREESVRNINEAKSNMKEDSAFSESALMETLGFVPTIKNMFKMAFAHMDAFMNAFYNMLDKISEEGKALSGSHRNMRILNDKGIIASDVKYSSGDKLLPPFPLFTREGENGKNEIRWPGDFLRGDNLEEMDLVKALHEAANMYVAEKDGIEMPKGGDDMIPVTYYDVLTRENPYKVLNGYVNDSRFNSYICFIFSLRCYYYMITNEDKSDMNIFVDSEIKNFIAALKDDINLNVTSSIQKGYYRKVHDSRNKDVIYYAYNIHEEKICDKKIHEDRLILFKQKNRDREYIYDWMMKDSELYLPVGEFDIKTILNDYCSSGSSNLNSWKYLNLSNNKSNDVFELRNSDYLNDIFENGDEKLSSLYKNMFPDLFDDLAKYYGDDNDGLSKINGTKCNNIFMHEFYYIQYDVDSFICDCKRALLFLFSICGSKDSLEMYNKSGIVNYISLLREGGLYYREDYLTKMEDGKYDDELIDRLYYGEGIVISTTKKYDFYCDEKGMLCEYTKYYDFDNKGALSNASVSRKTYLKSVFMNWVKEDFRPNIADKYEIKKNGKTITPKEFYTMKCFDKNERYESNKLTITLKLYEKKLLCNTKGEGKITEEEIVKNKKTLQGTVYKIGEDGKYFGYTLKKGNYICAIIDEMFQPIEYNGEKNKTFITNGIYTIKNGHSTYGLRDRHYLYGKVNKDEESYTDFINLIGEKRLVIEPSHIGEKGLNVNYNKIDCAITDFFNKLKENIAGLLKEEETEDKVDLFSSDSLLSTYLQLKSLYDKWLCCNNRGTWSLDEKYANESEFLNGSFHFIDAYYNDIGDQLIINPNHMIDILANNMPTVESMKNVGSTKYPYHTLYEFLSEICEKNRVIFQALPIFYGMKGNENIKNMFEAKPFIDSFSNNTERSSYVCIYPYTPSTVLDIEDNSYEYENDGFDMKPSTKDAEQAYIDTYDENKYEIPAFGVSYAKGNQSYFKSITLTTKTHQTTEASIAATLSIAGKSDEMPNNYTMFGQDLYRVYSNYSYQCDVNMMGCIQIMPLMYFQLNNIPMWHGAYQIIRVDHSISNGMMDTNFTGVRICKYALPLVDAGTLISDFANDIKNKEINNENMGEIVNPNNLKIKEISDNERNNNKKIIKSYLMKTMGLSDNWACAIMGIISCESSFNPAAFNKWERSGSLTGSSASYKPNMPYYEPETAIKENKQPYRGMYSYGAGIIQWSHWTRKVKVIEFVREKGSGKEILINQGGIESMTLEEQLQMLDKEINTFSFYKKLKNEDLTLREALACVYCYYVAKYNTKSTSIPTEEQIYGTSGEYGNLNKVAGKKAEFDKRYSAAEACKKIII